jgi:hypothetical protein
MRIPPVFDGKRFKWPAASFFSGTANSSLNAAISVAAFTKRNRSRPLKKNFTKIT